MIGVKVELAVQPRHELLIMLESCQHRKSACIVQVIRRLPKIRCLAGAMETPIHKHAALRMVDGLLNSLLSRMGNQVSGMFQLESWNASANGLLHQIPDKHDKGCEDST